MGLTDVTAVNASLLSKLLLLFVSSLLQCVGYVGFRSLLSCSVFVMLGLGLDRVSNILK